MWLFGWTRKKELRFDVATVSDRGLVRSENQDSFFADALHGVFGVADGMGGGEGGALASAWVCEGLSIAAETFSGSTADERYSVIDDVLQRTNKRIRAYAQEKGFRMMGSTVALAAFDVAAGAMQLVHAGDSRVYRLRRRQLEQLTRDHTVGDELSRMVPGEGSGGRDFRSRRNPLTHILTRAVGTELNVRPDRCEFDFQRGDKYLLCTDGVHDMLSDSDIAGLMSSRGSPESIVTRFAEAIRAAGAADNFTLVFVSVA
jgi:protein phosphatase